MKIQLQSEIVGNRLVFDAFYDYRKKGHINICAAGTGVGKTYISQVKIIPKQIAEGCTKFLITTPLTDAGAGAYRQMIKYRKKIERKLEKELGQDFDISITSDISEFLDSFSDPSRIMVLCTNHDQILTGKTFGTPNKELLIQHDLNYLSEGQMFIICDEIHYGGSTEPATYKGNTGVGNPKYKAAMINFLALLKDRHWVLALTATLLHEQEGITFGILQDLLKHPDIFNICTADIAVATHEELTHILSNYAGSLWIGEHDTDLIEQGVAKFEEICAKVNSKAIHLTESFGDVLKFTPRQVALITCNYGTYKGRPTLQNGIKMSVLIAREKVRDIKIASGHDKNIFCLAETTKDGAFLWNLNNDKIEVEATNLENILNGKDPMYPDVRYLFTVEKFKMAMNVPCITVHMSCRPRVSTVLKNTKNPETDSEYVVSVTIRQLMGRAIRPFFGIDLSLLGEGVYNPEQVRDIIFEKFSKHSDFAKLLEYLKICNSHFFVLPDLQSYHDAIRIWKEGFSAPLSKSIFQLDSKKSTFFTNQEVEEIELDEEDLEECELCGAFKCHWRKSDEQLDVMIENMNNDSVDQLVN